MFLTPADVREWLPEGHLAWFVIDAMAEMDLSAFYSAYRRSPAPMVQSSHRALANANPRQARRGGPANRSSGFRRFGTANLQHWGADRDARDRSG
jgi:hypothetical protein